ncbi:hypothetical protein ILUMI_00832 [Ignelater luminosus]|uniref:Tesmin/TSO1-like CXC domain-containing protein n=1 Tax=Ignelater luminosus TaxID=2038154 RepID=A0A8K0DGH6_IGNLU|nr:hypothetical protein ILUMI_00832 [Ignelater luminosus]
MQAVENADSTIISNAFQLGQQSGTAVILVGEDVDLLILLTAAAPVSSKTYLLKPGKGKQADMLYSPLGFNYWDKMFGQGRLKFVKTLEKNIHLQQAVTIFSKPDATVDEVGRAGQQFIATFLPPTEAAARHDFLRTHLQIEMWKGNILDPLIWGWKTTKHSLLPLTIDKAAAPEELINSIFCKCTKGCHGSCICKNIGMKCTNVCKRCKDQSCKNSPADDKLVTNCAPTDDESKAILAIQKGGEVVEEEERD